MDKLPEELIHLILSNISSIIDLENIRLSCHDFHNGISLMNIKQLKFKNKLFMMKFDQCSRHKKIRKHCLNEACQNRNIQIGNLYLFQYNDETHDPYKRILPGPDKGFLWIFQDSDNEENYNNDQITILSNLEIKNKNNEGDFTNLYIPYCLCCKSQFIIKK